MDARAWICQRGDVIAAPGARAAALGAAALIAVVLSACAGQSKTPGARAPAGGTKTVAPDDEAGTTAPDSGTPARDTAGAAAGGPKLPAKGIRCATQPCMYHPGTRTYHLCLSSGAGTCFHYGRTCAPAGGCMYDASTSSYRSCSRVSEGTCLAFGAACTPPGACMLDRSDDMHHVCEELEGGTCKRFGALCVPR